jgi:hypothetical protein
VTIGAKHVLGSPVSIRFVSTEPVFEHTELSGLGGRASKVSSRLGAPRHPKLGDQAVVGEKSVVRILLKDRFQNAITPTARFKESFAFGMGLPDRSVKGNLQVVAEMTSVPFEGRWVTSSEGSGDDTCVCMYEITFVPSSTSIVEVWLWGIDSEDASPERHMLPGAPYLLNVKSNADEVVKNRQVEDKSGVLPRDYRIKMGAFEEAQRRWGPCTLDAFASKATQVLGRFWSSTHVDGVGGFLGVDALEQPWEHDEVIWAHPPVELLQAVITKLRTRERSAEVIVCAPQHRSRPWYLQLMALSDAQLSFPRGRLGPRRRDADRTHTQTASMISRQVFA